LPVCRLQAQNGFFLQIVQFNAESINDLEQESPPHISDRDTVFIAVDTDKAVIAYDPFLHLPGPVSCVRQQKQVLLFLDQIMLVMDTFRCPMDFITTGTYVLFSPSF